MKLVKSLVKTARIFTLFKIYDFSTISNSFLLLFMKIYEYFNVFYDISNISNPLQCVFKLFSKFLKFSKLHANCQKFYKCNWDSVKCWCALLILEPKVNISSYFYNIFFDVLDNVFFFCKSKKSSSCGIKFSKYKKSS